MPKSQENDEVLHSRIFSALVEKELRPAQRDRMTAPEHNYCLASHFDAEVTNGGISQFFTNPYGADYQKVILALRETGAVAQLEILEGFLSKIPPTIDPADQQQMGRYLFGDDLPAQQFEYLDDLYFEKSDSFYKTMVAYARRNRLAVGEPKGLTNSLSPGEARGKSQES